MWCIVPLTEARVAPLLQTAERACSATRAQLSRPYSAPTDGSTARAHLQAAPVAAWLRADRLLRSAAAPGRPSAAPTVAPAAGGCFSAPQPSSADSLGREPRRPGAKTDWCASGPVRGKQAKP